MSKFAEVKWKLMPGQIKVSGEVSEGAMVLKRFRVGKGMEREEFGRPLNVSGAYIKDLERGVSRINREFAVRVQWQYGLKADLLLE